jgi:hypothetical protein
MRFLKTALVILFVAVLGAAVSASSLDVGASARSVAMGGAGLALGDRLGTTAIVNPAAPAACSAGSRFVWPALSLHTTGASVSDLSNSIDNLSGGDDSDAISLVNDFATQDTTLSVNSMMGFVGPFGIIVQGQANGIIAPGDAAAEWARAAQKFEDAGSVDLDSLSTTILNPKFQAALASANAYIASDDDSDLAAAQAHFADYLTTDLSDNFVDADLVYGPSIMFSHGFEKAGGTLYLGATGRILHSEARKWQITASPDAANLLQAPSTGNISAGVIFDAVETPVERNSSLAVDLGMIYKPRNSKWQYGAVINNAIQPKLNSVINAQTETTISFGIATIPVKGMIFAADLCNITGANGEDMELRFGGEWNWGSALALRAGYSGQNWTYGLRVFGINAAFQGRTAQLLTNLIKF